ncbi:MAG: DNA-directed RNA polymerase subunit omega [Chthoniobacterales bacterium]|nr:DNA-directed RNA polymerase subunit omega [Chthoniobacterales bacterium]
MNPLLIEQAAAIIPNKQVLINAVSKRVRQLMAGSRPLIEDSFRKGLADIALSEIAAGKIQVIDREILGEELFA